MFSLNLLNQNLPIISNELSRALKSQRITPIFASCVGSCVYEMKSSNSTDFAYKDLDIVVMANNLQSNQAVNFTHKLKDFKLDIQVLSHTKAQELIESHYLFMLEAALSPNPLVFINSPKSSLTNLKFSKHLLGERSEKVMIDTINKSLNLLSTGFLQNSLELIEHGKKLTWQAMRVDLMTHYLINHPPHEVAKSEDLKRDFFSIANVYYQKLQTLGADVKSVDEWSRVVQGLANNFALNDFNTLFCKSFSPQTLLIDINSISLASPKINI